MKITGIVVTYNEETNIKECLQSLDWVDELIIVDSNSTDETIPIATSFTKSIYTLDSQIIAEKRKFAQSKAENEWILFVDADERIPKELKNEIASLKNEIHKADGFYINRKNYYFGRLIKNCGISPDYVLRLFRKDKAKVTDRLIHEGVQVEGNCRYLKNSIEHFTVNDLTQMIKKSNFFSSFESKEFLLNGKRITKSGVFAHAISAFLRIYISRKGFKDKLSGFFVAFSYSFTNFLSNLKLLKLQKRI